MKRFLAFGLTAGFLVGFWMICEPSNALAQTANSIIVAGCGFPLASDCTTQDTTSTVTNVTMKVNPRTGVITAVCHGLTQTPPSKATKCSGEALNAGAPSPETSPTAPCELQAAQFNSSETQFTDDWTQVVTPSGHITLKCTFNPNEKPD